ncbi:MAG TPA: hypothetical protein VMH39_07395, partial [Gemmatimonadaceae bacterium]|nr:hypothetical protein [Gemmatimonadaceae bacterium]
GNRGLTRVHHPGRRRQFAHWRNSAAPSVVRVSRSLHRGVDSVHGPGAPTHPHIGGTGPACR